MTAGSELGLWWYFWYVLAGVGKNHHRPTTEPEMPAGLILYGYYFQSSVRVGVMRVFSHVMVLGQTPLLCLCLLVTSAAAFTLRNRDSWQDAEHLNDALKVIQVTNNS